MGSHDDDCEIDPESVNAYVQPGDILFNNQFTPDEVYDNYPADRLMHDIALALMATQTQTTEVLDTFPTIPAEAENPEVTIPQEA